MRVEMTFDAAAADSNGYEMTTIHRTIKNAFAKLGLSCSSESGVLAFVDNGGEDDFAYMWNILLSLLKSDWFVQCASSCSFFDDDGSEEDVLAQAWKVRKQQMSCNSVF